VIVHGKFAQKPFLKPSIFWFAELFANRRCSKRLDFVLALFYEPGFFDFRAMSLRKSGAPSHRVSVLDCVRPCAALEVRARFPNPFFPSAALQVKLWEPSWRRAVAR